MARNYKEEYKHFHSKPDEKKRRAGRNAARKKMAAAGKVKKGDGKDNAHVPGSNRTRLTTAHYNRGNERRKPRK